MDQNQDKEERNASPESQYDGKDTAEDREKFMS